MTVRNNHCMLASRSVLDFLAGPQPSMTTYFVKRKRKKGEYVLPRVGHTSSLLSAASDYNKYNFPSPRAVLIGAGKLSNNCVA